MQISLQTIFKNTYTIEDKIGVSVSVDSYKVSQFIKYNPFRKKVFGGAAPSHYLDIGDGEERKEIFQEMMDYFNDKNNKIMQKSAEVKVGRVLFQDEMNGMSL